MPLRPYAPRDEDAAMALWLRSWQAAYPEIDFAARLDWWRERWRRDLVPAAEIIVAEADGDGGGDGAIIGFVTVDPRTRYLDQLVVAPEHWRGGVGSDLVAKAKRLSPSGLDLDVNTDNERALRFYSKLEFAVAREGVNPISGKPVYRMTWRP